MNTHDLAREVHRVIPEVTIEKTKEIIEKAFEIIPEAVINDPVRVFGFGEFSVTKMKPKKVKVFGGEVKEIPSRMKLKFRAFKKAK